jgi:hypothetical protein
MKQTTIEGLVFYEFNGDLFPAVMDDKSYAIATRKRNQGDAPIMAGGSFDSPIGVQQQGWDESAMRFRTTNSVAQYRHTGSHYEIVLNHPKVKSGWRN